MPSTRGSLRIPGDPEWWIQPVKWAALVVWLAVPLFSYFDIRQPWPAHIVWSVVAPGLPLFIILAGYHRWRRICPLAFFSQIPVLLRRPGTRRASPWFEERYYYLMVSLFALGLWMRLTVINGNGQAMAAFFVLLSVAALIAGALFTGKTWCNYICPVSLIEKINTEPHGLRETRNSQCVKCTACKRSCPDINEENGYWKESDLPSKRFAYFAFPGLVFAFFLYFYLQSGTWDYYFGGGWADQPALIYKSFRWDETPMSAGFFFLPQVPRALAALLTLAAGAVASFFLFAGLEPYVGAWLRRRRAEADAGQVRHVMFTTAAFIAFANFYVFTGQPLLRPIPWLAPLAAIFAATVGALVLARRFGRTQKAFAEQTIALNIIKRWEWPDMGPPKDLHEALLIHTARATEKRLGYAQILEAYGEAVRETLAHGFVTREDVQRLESLRNQLQIKKADHEKLMATLAEEDRARLAGPLQAPSAEKRLQLQTYRRALERHLKLALAPDTAADDRLLRQLRREYNVTEEEHAAQLDAVLGGVHGMAAQVAEGLHEVARTGQMIKALEAEPSPAHEFVVDLLRRQRARAVDRLVRVRILDLDPGDEKSRVVRDGLCSDDEGIREMAVDGLCARVTPAVAERLLSVRRQTGGAGVAGLTLAAGLRALADSADPYVRAFALYALGERGGLDAELLGRLGGDEHEVVRETAWRLKARIGDAGGLGRHGPATIVERMIALRSVSVFASLEPEDLAELSRSSVEEQHAPGEVLAREGESADEVFVVLEGSVVVLHRVGTGEDFVLEQRSAGEIIGEIAVLDPAPRPATLRAGDAGARVLRLSGSAFRETLSADPAVASGVIRALAQRVRGLIHQVGGPG